MHLAGIHLTLNDVQDANVTAASQFLGASMRRNLQGKGK